MAESGGEQQGSGARPGARAVFISYASQDKATADAICASLENEGIGYWMAPRDVTPGEFYADAIVRALNKAQVPLLALTEHALNSPHVLREVERTSSKRHPNISLRIGTVSLPPALEYFLSSSQWLEANGSAVKESFPKLIAAQLIREAAELNPLSTFTLAWFANVLFADNNLAEAERIFREMLELRPGLPGVHCQPGQVLLAEHRPDAALETMSKEPQETSRLICMPIALWSLNRQPEADALLAQAKEKYQDLAAYGVGSNYALRGDKDEAFKWLNRAFDNHDLHLQFLNEDPSFRTLHSDPRFAALGRRIEATKTK